MKSCTINKDLIQEIFLSIPLLLGIVIYPLCFHTDVYLWNITMVFVKILKIMVIFPLLFLTLITNTLMFSIQLFRGNNVQGKNIFMELNEEKIKEL